MRTSDRLVVALIGAFNLFAAWQISTVLKDKALPFRPFWPAIFAIAALLCFVLELRFHHRTLFALTGAFSATVYAATSGCLVIEMINRVIDATAVAQLSAAQWALLAGLVRHVFFRTLGLRTKT